MVLWMLGKGSTTELYQQQQFLLLEIEKLILFQNAKIWKKGMPGSNNGQLKQK